MKAKCALLVALASVFFPTAAFAWDSLPLADYVITTQQNGMAIDVTGSNPANGTPIIMWTRHGAPNQVWQLKPTDGQAYYLVNKATGKCLDVSDVSKANGARIHEWDCWGAPNQQWLLYNTGDGAYAMVSVNSGVCLDVVGFDRSAGAALQQWSCSNGINQHWIFSPVDGSTTGGNTGGSTGGNTGGSSGALLHTKGNVLVDAARQHRAFAWHECIKPRMEQWRAFCGQLSWSMLGGAVYS